MVQPQTATEHSYFSSGLLPIIVAILTSFVLLSVYKVVVRPLLRMRFYKKQRLPTSYFPFFGCFQQNFQDLKEHGDFYYSAKHGKKDYSVRAHCSNLAYDPIIFLNDPALIREFFLHPERYTRDRNYLDIISMLEGNGMFMAEGKQWKAQRKILSSSFNFEFLKSMLPEIQAISKRRFQELRNSSLKDVRITEVFQQIAADVIGSIFFGSNVNDYKVKEGKTLTAWLGDILLRLGDFTRSPAVIMFGSWTATKGLIPGSAQVIREIKAFRSVCMEIISQRRREYETEGNQPKDGRSKNMIEVLLDYKGEEGRLTDEKILDEFVTFYAAGTDTTSHLLTMMMVQFAQYPEAAVKLSDEINRSYNNKKAITVDELNSLEYLVAFIKETFRTNGPVPGIITRIALEDHQINDLSIRKGDLINLDIFTIHYNPEHFPDSMSFLPERWLSKDASRDPYVFIPFGAGPRNCLGQHLAMNEARIIFCELLSIYEFKVGDNYKLEFGFKLMYGPMDPYRVNLMPKDQ